MSKQPYGGGGGLSKHRKSGKTTKSPKVRMQMQLEAQKVDIKAPPPLPYESVSDVFKKYINTPITFDPLKIENSKQRRPSNLDNKRPHS